MAQGVYRDETTPWRRDRSAPYWIALGFVVVSVIVHVVAFTGASAYAKLQALNRPLNQPIEMVMIEVEPPPPPPPPEPKVEEPEPPPKPKPKVVKPPPVKVAKPEKPVEPPPEEAPPPPNEEPPPETPANPVPLVVGISMSSTSTSGGFAAPVGNTLMGQTDTTAKDPSQVQTYRAPKYVPSYQVDSQPVLLQDVKVPYPNEARRAGVEGQVILSLKIDETGKVVGARVLSGPGYGLDEAALSAVRRFRFKPAIKNGEAVSTEIKYTYTFWLD